FSGIIFRNVFRHIGLEPALVFPDDEVRRVRRIDDVDCVNVGGVFLADTLKETRGTGTLDGARNAVLGFKYLADLLRELGVDRGLDLHSAVFLGARDQRGRTGDQRGRGTTDV